MTCIGFNVLCIYRLSAEKSISLSRGGDVKKIHYHHNELILTWHMATTSNNLNVMFESVLAQEISQEELEKVARAIRIMLYGMLYLVYSPMT